MAEMIPPQGAPQQAPQGQEQGMSEVGKMIENVGRGLAMVTQLMTQGGAPPEVTQKMAQITQEYQSVIEAMVGGGGGAPGGAVPSEAGAGQAQPMNPAMRG